MTEELRKRTNWTGNHRNVRLEVAFWGEGIMNDGRGMWNYYIAIGEEQLPSDEFEKIWLPVSGLWERSSGAKMPSYNEYESILNHGEFHGGITFYEKKQHPDTGARWIKVGCDYGHLWDQEDNYRYDLRSVAADARSTVDRLHEVLHFKVPCNWTGRYVAPAEAVEHEGRSYSVDGLAKMKESWK